VLWALYQGFFGKIRETMAEVRYHEKRVFGSMMFNLYLLSFVCAKLIKMCQNNQTIFPPAAMAILKTCAALRD